MSNVEVERSIEAILMVVDEPVTELVLAQVLERPVEEIEAALATLEGPMRNAALLFVRSMEDGGSIATLPIQRRLRSLY